ncbi:MAG: glycoside hydrolase family 3 protein, partial [Treponema sp.]|nr:glycoside hydrolase family 3 protein [Treponema sp.]
NVGLLGAAFARGQLDAGVIPTAKHFPGHGDTPLDSHGVLPRIDVEFETLWNRELIPYRMLIAEGIPAVMSGHLAFPLTPGGGAPASFSRWFLTDVLRNKMGFDGLIITDDLMMYGATIWAGAVSGSAKQALEAGNDIIMLSTTPGLHAPVWTLLLNSMRENPAFRARVREAARRTLLLKLQHLRGENAVPLIPDLQRVASELPHYEGIPFFLNLAARSATIVKPQGACPARGAVVPIRPEDAGRVLLAGQSSEFFRLGRIAFPGAASYWYAEGVNIPEFLTFVEQADTIIFGLSNASGVRVLQQLRRFGRRVIVLSQLNPVHFEQVPWVDGIVAIYSNNPDSLAAGFAAIVGRIPAAGRLPYDL